MLSARAGDRFADRVGVAAVVLATLTIGHHQRGTHQPYGMTKRSDRAGPAPPGKPAVGAKSSAPGCGVELCATPPCRAHPETVGKHGLIETIYVQFVGAASVPK